MAATRPDGAMHDDTSERRPMSGTESERRTKVCPGCGIILDREAAVCPRCRTVQPDAPAGTHAEMMPTPRPSARRPGAGYSRTPGAPPGSPVGAPAASLAELSGAGIAVADAPSEKKLAIAFLLCFLLPLTGAHRFYAGRPASGLLQLLTAGGMGIWWLVDLVTLPFGGFKDGRGRRISDWA